MVKGGGLENAMVTATVYTIGARVVVPGLPHHVTRRGNRREPVFFGAEDYQLYRGLIARAARGAGAEIWTYRLVPNHVHLIARRADCNGLRRTFGEAHRR
jgi:putative transposase